MTNRPLFKTKSYSQSPLEEQLKEGRQAVFLDRDGVLNQLIYRNGKAQAPYLIEEFALIEGVKEACVELKSLGFLLIVVTNQPDVARGWVSKESVDLMNETVRSLLPIDDIKVCWHTNDHGCECRKPLPGMLVDSAKKWNINLKKSFMVGDRFGDISAGRSAGCQTILVGPGDAQGGHPEPHFRSLSLFDALPLIRGAF